MNLFHISMIGIGAMIGAGIFVLTGIAAGKAGPALTLAFLLNGFVTLLTALAYAELGSCFPEAGGGYLWVKQALPGPNGFLAGWMSWFAHVVACSLYARGFGSYVVETLHSLSVIPTLGPATADTIGKLFALAAIVAFAYVNVRGAADTGTAEGYVTIGKLAILGLFILCGLWATFRQPAWHGKFDPFMPTGTGGILMAMALTFIAFEGYEIIAQCGEEVANPKRNVPRAIFICLAIPVPIYVLVAFVCIGGIHPPGGEPTWQFLRDMEEPELGVVAAARQFMLGGPALLLVGGLLSTISALNATIYSSSRVSYAMGRSSSLPGAFARIHPKRKTPHVAVSISAALTALMALALPIERVAAATDLMFLLLFLQVNVALLVLRRRRPDLDRGFRVPLVWLTAPMGMVGLVVLSAVLYRDHASSFAYAAAWIAVGVGIYYWYARPRERSARDSQLLVAKPAPAPTDYAVVVPLAHPARVANLVGVAAAMARRHGGHVVALHVIRVPAPTPLEAGEAELAHAHALLAQAVDVAGQWGVQVETAVRVGRRVPDAILEAVERTQARLLILGWRGGRPREGVTFGSSVDPVIRRAPCDVAVLRAGWPLLDWPDAEGRGPAIVCPTTGSRHSLLAVEFCFALSDQLGGTARFVHVVPPGATPAAGVATLREAGVEVTVIEAAEVEEAIADEAEAANLVVLGATRTGLFAATLFGSVAEHIASSVATPVLMVKQYPGRVAGAIREMLRPLEPDEIAAHMGHGH
jgi:amino acid transporter/nucleotide-binding universal stress UspA family protein